ncbi:MAG TPA: urea carboxylase-associated family protein [Solirubrobacteraceae bacterium]|nr:urea carboxylase-associated family protein [Solirubrobacteraceae bacterium]
MTTGALSEDFVLAPASCVARTLRRGQTLCITDLEGQQVADLIAFVLPELSDRLWPSTTIRLNGTVYLTTGHVLYSELSRPLLEIVHDTCGRHDILAGSCNAEIDEVRYGVRDHRGCVEQFVEAIEPWGLRRADVPMSFNVFMNCPVKADGSWSIAEPVSRPGDRLALRARTDLLVAISNCPQDLNPCNAGRPKPLGISISAPPSTKGEENDRP